MHSADVRVLRQRAPVTGIDAKHTNTTVALQRVAFGPNTAPGANSVDLAVFDSAAAVLYNASFSDDGTVDIDKRFGSVYAATPAAYRLRAGSDPVQPLSALPQNLTFLGGRDPELLLIQEVRSMLEVQSQVPSLLGPTNRALLPGQMCVIHSASSQLRALYCFATRMPCDLQCRKL